MFRKVNSKILLGVLVVLLLIVILLNYKDKNHEERTFRKELVKVDSSMVTALYLYPSSLDQEEIIISRIGQKWELISGDKRANADQKLIKNMMGQLLLIVPKSVAATSNEKWEKFEVSDSSSTKVIVFENGEPTTTLFIGKFSYNETTRSTTTYIRLKGDDEVYSIESMMGYIFNRGFLQMRDRTIIKGNKENWTKLAFNYSTRSSFVLNKLSEHWLINGEVTDSAKTEKFLADISNVVSPNMMDGLKQELLGDPISILKIEGNNLRNPIEVIAYPADTINKYFITSSLNPGAIFVGGRDQLYEKLFLDGSFFLIDSEE